MKKIKIRNKILAVFSLMLLTTFLLIGVIFNIAVDRYIRANALAQLNVIREGALAVTDIARTNSPPEFSGRGNVFRISANVFIVDGEYFPIDGQLISPDADEIIKTAEARGIGVSELKNARIKTGGGVYYVSANFIPGYADEAYMVAYADISGLTYFAGTINLMLIVLVCAMFALTVAATFFLSNSITKPINRLALLAENIGRGDFTPRDFNFKDLEFVSLNKTLNGAARQLGKYDGDQKTFFQNASHELRTPLMSIKCYAEGIAYGIMEPAEASGVILRETDRLSEMVGDLLYISKIDNITAIYPKKNTELTVLLGECIKRQSAVAAANGVNIKTDFGPDISIECIAELFARAVDNLISNAVRYAKNEVVVSCRADKGKTVITIKDDGPGIEPDALPKIFGRFYKGSGGGHGIGLSIVKSAVEAHGGTVAAVNNASGGADFTIIL